MPVRRKKPKLCKHDFPMSDRLNLDEALFICPGLAKRWRLRQSGPRNMLGCYLGLRNSEWIDGTAPALCVGLTGGNTDVKVVNDRMPITEETHEASCKKNCLRENLARRIQRKMMRAHANTNGYFGGYIAKRQPCGRFEAKKCINKMHELRRKKADASAGGKLRAASGRMVTDLEMNGVLRGAVEEFNLCKNLREGDVLFAECVRTYATITVNAQEWLHRLEVELQPLRAVVVGSRHVPATSRPSFRTTRVRAPLVDLYGFRPLTEEFALLSPYEFVQYWEALPVAQPGNTNKTSATGPRWQGGIA